MTRRAFLVVALALPFASPWPLRAPPGKVWHIGTLINRLGPGANDAAFNLKTAKAFGFTIPQSLLLRADEVIQ